MPGKARHLIIIGKERPFDEQQWQQLLTAFAYVLHERRQATAASTPASEHGEGDQAQRMAPPNKTEAPS